MRTTRHFETWITKNFGEDVIESDGIRDMIIDGIEQTNNAEWAIKRTHGIARSIQIMNGDCSFVRMHLTIMMKD